jgi:hypothetical protein
VNLLGDNTDTIKKNTETLTEINIEINIQKPKYMLLNHHQNTGQNRDIKTANRSFGNVSHIKIFVDDSNKSEFDSLGN